MSHEDVKLEAWQAAVSPKLDCSGLCEEAMLFIVCISMIEGLGRSLNVQVTCASTFEVRMRK